MENGTDIALQFIPLEALDASSTLLQAKDLSISQKRTIVVDAAIAKTDAESYCPIGWTVQSTSELRLTNKEENSKSGTNKDYNITTFMQQMTKEELCGNLTNNLTTSKSMTLTHSRIPSLTNIFLISPNTAMKTTTALYSQLVELPDTILSKSYFNEPKEI